MRQCDRLPQVTWLEHESLQTASEAQKLFKTPLFSLSPRRPRLYFSLFFELFGIVRNGTVPVCEGRQEPAPRGWPGAPSRGGLGEQQAPAAAGIAPAGAGTPRHGRDPGQRPAAAALGSSGHTDKKPQNNKQTSKRQVKPKKKNPTEKTPNKLDSKKVIQEKVKGKQTNLKSLWFPKYEKI